MRIILLAFSLLLSGLSGAWAQAVQVKGTIKNIPQGLELKAKLLAYKGDKLEPNNFTTVDNTGTFTFSLQKAPHGVYQVELVGYATEDVVLGKEPVVYVAGDFNTIRENGLMVMDSKENDAVKVVDNFYGIFAAKLDSLNNISSRLDAYDPFKETRTKEIKAARDKVIHEFNNSISLSKNLFPDTYMAEILVPMYMVPNYADFEEYKDKFDNDVSFRHIYYFEYIDFSDPRILRNPILPARFFQYLNDYTAHNLAGFQFAVDHLMKKSSANEEVKAFTFEYLVNIFNENGPVEMIEYLQNGDFLDGCSSPVSDKTKEIMEKANNLKPGSPAPELVINDFNYQPVSMGGIKAKAKFIYFWASWCAHCMEHTPEVFELYQKYKDKGLEVYAVSLDKEYSDWVKAIQDMGLTWQNVSELKEWDSESSKAYGISKTPTIILLDENNRIVKRDISPGELRRKLDEMLN